MRKAILMILSLAAASLPAAARAQQQSQPPAQPQTQSKTQSQTQHDSLAEAARKAREQRKSITKPAKVYDNDNIARNAGTISVVGETAGTTSKGEAAALTKEAKTDKKDEAYWRARFDKAHAKLKKDQDELEVLQRELGQLQVQFYPDPQKALQQQYTRADINAQTAKIDAKQKEIQQDQQALSDLEDELRRSGGDPGWARE